MTKFTMRLLPALMMFGFAGVASASGFALQNQTGSGNGNAFAGAAAAAEDAGTVYFNPAGMTYLGQGHSISASGTILNRSINFKNTGTTNGAVMSPGNTGNGGDAGGTSFLPHGYWAYSIAPDVWVGVGVGPTFGNVTEYNKNFIGKNAGYFADIEQININPSLAFKVNDMLSLGLGIDISHASLEFKQGVPTSGTNYMDVKSDGAWGVGANIGAMFQLSPSTRIGLTYRSSIDFDMQGDARFHPAIPAAGAVNQRVKANGYQTPGSFSSAVSQKLSDRWELLGDATWTNWSTFQDLTLTSKDGYPGVMAAGTTTARLPYAFKSTWRVGLGANYTYNDVWKFRMGYAYDQSPVNGANNRTMTLPDSDRQWLSFGGKYTLSKVASLDFGYSHIFFKDATTARAVRSSAGALLQTVNGKFDSNSADILSVQYNHKF